MFDGRGRPPNIKCLATRDREVEGSKTGRLRPRPGPDASLKDAQYASKALDVEVLSEHSFP